MRGRRLVVLLPLAVALLLDVGLRGVRRVVVVRGGRARLRARVLVERTDEPAELVDEGKALRPTEEGAQPVGLGAAPEVLGRQPGALHDEHGKVTYLQQVTKGGFYVLVGEPKKLKEKFFPAGTWVGFIDAEGPGHASRVGPKDVERTFRMLKGHLKV